MSFCDLHTHSNRSDGTLSPSELAAVMKAAGSAAFALTDHETVAGLDDAARGAEAAGIAFIPGIEISTEFSGHEYHIVGLFIDSSSKELNSLLTEQLVKRRLRNDAVAKKLEQLGIHITPEAADGAVLTRAHFARALYEKGYSSSVKQAFSDYLCEGGKAYIVSERAGAAEAIGAILAADGIPILAHLSTYKNTDPFEIALTFKKFGLMGIECHYAEYSPEFSRRCLAFAAENGFLVSGGSDYHGSNKPNRPCAADNAGGKISYSVCEKLMISRRKNA